MSSLGRNIIASYAGQIYVAAIGIVMVPLYVRYMGAESYGLVGFFSMLQAWFQLLDLGMAPTMAREAARFRGGASDALSLRRLLHFLECIFSAVALLGATAMILGAKVIAMRWLTVEQLPIEEVRLAIMLMGVSVALRLVSGLYRGVVGGFERLAWLSGFNCAIATARFVLVIPFFAYVGTRPAQFFTYQLIVAVVELLLLILIAYRLMPAAGARPSTPWQWRSLRDALVFSTSIAFTSSVWVFVTQTDKLVLSKLLPLSDYAYYTLAVLAASGVMIMSGPISTALLPRLARLQAQGDEASLIELYGKATQVACIVVVPIALVLAFFAEQVLWIWTGDPGAARAVAPVLALYVAGNGILAVSAFPYYLQFAKGRLQLHLIGSVLFILLLLPSLIWATLQYGMVGAGCAWLAANALYFLVWVPTVHSRFLPGLHLRWLSSNVVPIVLLAVLVCGLTTLFARLPGGRIDAAIGVAVAAGLTLLAALLGSSFARPRLFGVLARLGGWVKTR